MKNGRLLILMLILMLIPAVILAGCRKRTKTPSEVVEYLKDLKTYTCNVEITMKNDRQEIKYDCRQYFDKSLGYRLEIGEDRIQVHRDNKIYVTDRKNSSKYVLDSDFDRTYSLSFIGNYIKLLYTNEEIKYSNKEEEGQAYQLIELLIPGNNRNLFKAEMYVNMKTYKPEKILVYDYKNYEKVSMVYSDFKANEVVNKELFNVN